MQTDIFDFPFDDKHIALNPLEPRENAKLMVIKDNQMTHNHVRNLIDYFQADDVIVLNNTKVIKARLTGVIITKGRTAQCQVTLHKHILLNDTTKTTYTAFVKGSKKLNIDDILEFKTLNSDIIITAKIISKDNLGQVHIQFNCNLSDLFILLDNIGTMPLPPYIEKHRHADIDDDTNYQTIFAEHLGSVAAPTASLHLTENILQQIAKKGIKIAYVTLHVGGGTFLPVKSDTIDQHYMHSEIIDINAQNAQIINEAKQNGGRVICVGTTALRVVESVVDNSGTLRAFTGETDIFIYPSYRFKICDILMTNFHLPKSTLFMLVCALCGIDMMKYAYKTAQEMDYRFFSYGDACLLHKVI
jgi:S-adenosylmethionine:tRNA ribosyltransferase-isomerase